jgi:cellulose synthase/poly-beta-1,6-N-acetylglucosamine synthase-like glycosyltransferase
MLSLRKTIGAIIIIMLIAAIMYAFYFSFREVGFWTLLYIPEMAILLMCLYVFLPALIFFTGHSRIKKSFVSTLPETDKQRSFFTLLIPAHNEERLLPALLESLKNQTYAKDFFQVVVVADNCNDRTTLIAEMYGVHCLNRSTVNISNKRDALRHAIETFNFAPDFQDGYVCVIDADCEAHPDFLRELNQQLLTNTETIAIQSYRYVKNVYESNITLLDGASEALRNWVFCAPRKLAGLSVFGNGSGIVFKKTLFDKLIHLPGRHLAEDKEWNAYLAEYKIKVDYCACARLGYEAVALNKDFQKQRKRWIGSHIDMMKTYSWKMLIQSILNLNLMQFDCFCALMQIPRSLLLVSCLLFSGINLIAPQSSFLPHWGWLIITCCLILYGILGLYLVKARKRDYLAIPYMLQLVSGIIKTTFISLVGKETSEWNATRVENE